MRLAAEILFVLWLVLLPGVVSAATEAQEGAIPALMERARASLERGDLEAAAAGLEQVLARDEGHKGARVALAQVLVRLGRWSEAEAQARNLGERFPDDAEPLYVGALVAFQRGEMERVCELAGLGLARGDRRAEVYKLLALAEYLLRRHDQFELHIRAAIDLNPSDADAHYHLGRHLFETKRYRDALDSFQAALRLQPDHYKAHYYAGVVLDGEQEGERAKEEFLAAIRIVERQKIRYAWPFTDLGQRLIKDGAYDRGLAWLYRAVRQDPASPHAWYGYAKGLFERGATGEVKEATLEAIRLDPGYGEAYYLLARYYQKAGESRLAKETFAKFEEIKRNPVPSPYGVRRQ